MKMMNKTSLAIAVAAALGIASQQAAAVIKLNFQTGDATGYVDAPGATAPAVPIAAVTGPMLFAAEETGESSLGVKNLYATVGAAAGIVWNDGDLSVAIPVPSSYSVVGVKTMFVKVTLTGGAKFYAEPYLVCPNQQTAAGAATFASVLSGGFTSAGEGSTAIAGGSGLISTANNTPVAGKATAVFNIVSGLTTIASGYCALTFASPAIAAAGAALTAYTVTTRGEIGMNVEVGYTLGGAATTAIVSGTIIKFVPKLKGVVTAYDRGGAAAAVTIDVKQASKKFSGASPTVGFLGHIRVTSATTAGLVRVSTLSATDASASVIMSTGTVTINGALIAGVQNITLYQSGAAGATCTVPSTAPAGSPSVTTGGGGNVTISSIPIGELTAGLNVCANIAGTTTLNGGQITALLAGGGMTNFTTSLGSESNLVNVGINGARVRVLQIPGVGNTDQAFIRFYNTGNTDAIVRGTLYGMDGKMLSGDNVELFNTLKANDVEVLDAAKLAAKMNITTPWTGKAWLLVQAEIEPASFKVQALLRTPANILVNLSTDALN